MIFRVRGRRWWFFGEGVRDVGVTVNSNIRLKLTYLSSVTPSSVFGCGEVITEVNMNLPKIFSEFIFPEVDKWRIM
jgi:hypothetical protein